MSVLNQDVEIINKLGLHARAAAALVRVTNQFDSDITLAKGGIAVNAKSILGMMTLAAGPGSTIRVKCAGDDADAAMTAVIDCITNRFGEPE